MSAKADNLVKAVKARRLLEIDTHPDFGNTTHRAQGLLINPVQNIHAHMGEGYFLPECPENLSCTNSARRTISGAVCEKNNMLMSKRN